MRNYWFFLLVSLIGFPAQSQVERVTWNGKEYYVYPHQDESQVQESYSPFNLFSMLAESQEVLQRDDKNRKVISVTVEPIDKKEKGPFLLDGRKFKKTREFIALAMQHHPEIFYSYSAGIDGEIIPATEPLPDGEYIQYYRDLPYLDGKILRYRNDVVAAVFSIKNGQLDGYAKWIAADGKLIKQGNYLNGARHGEWNVFSYEAKYDETQTKIPEPRKYTLELLEESIAKQQYDTVVERWEFQNGLREGKYTKIQSGVLLQSGHYHDDEETGEWIIKEYRFDVNEKEGTFKRSAEPVLLKHYTHANPKKIGRSVIIRDDYMTDDFWIDEYEEEFDPKKVREFRAQYHELRFESFRQFYTLYEPEEETEDENLELPDEDNTSYEGSEDYYGDFEHYYDSPSTYKHYTRNDLIDSLGYQFEYEGVYEEYYDNGQLKLRFEVIDGVLVKEDTIFWDNGFPANVVNFLPDSNIYEQVFFDNEGKPFKRLTYDAKGNSLQKEEYEYEEYGYYDFEEDREIEINGRKYHEDHYWNKYVFKKDLKLDSITETQVLEETLWMRDSALATIETYNPDSRTLSETRYDISKKPIVTYQTVFNEDFTTLTGETDTRIANLHLHRQVNGSYIPDNPYMGSSGDSLRPERITYWRGQFDWDSDQTLFLDDKPFTGSFDMLLNQKKYGLKTTPNSIHFSLPENEGVLFGKVINKYYKKPNGKRDPLLDYTFMGNFAPITNGLNFLIPHLSFLSDLDSDYYRGDEENNPMIAGSKDYKITGTFLNGKPEGPWKTTDKSSETLVEVSFVKGEPDGVMKTYDVVEPLTKKQLKWLDKNPEYEEYILAETGYSLRGDAPLEKKRYVSRIATFRNGMQHGESVQFDWTGDTLSYSFYKDGRQDGTAFERTKYTYSVRNYEDGLLDGLAHTWITIPGREPILLYDLNFQNGGLQGESKAYHTNGKLAKHGFFLSGQPIDDYEAFDTLGVRYQYVKFLYNQPVEEKIWEENQLSVRYTFDWRDSIPFETWDISESSSLDRLLIEMDWSNGSEYQPYFGRPSLVDKSGIDYTMTKYYPNDKIAREGMISKGKKVGCWNYYSYDGRFLYEVDYADTIIAVNDSIRFKSKGILTYVDEKGDPLSHSYVIEKFEKYDCSHTDHYEERMLYAFWEKDTSVHRMNGYVKNYYDNGVLQNEGWVKDGLPTGVWKLYDNAGNLSHVGEYIMGKRQGRWLSGDLGQVKYLGDICLNPNLPNLEEIMAYQEKLLDITVVYYRLGSVIKTEYYGVNMNANEPPEGYEGEGDYFEGYYDED